MASSIFQKLIKNQSRYASISRTITTTTTTTSHPIFTTPQFQTPQIGEINPQNPILTDPFFPFGVYPSFSFDHFLNPVVNVGHDFGTVFEDDGVVLEKEVDGSNMIWADSVKKKRKKKMNKHKLKKLRKRLRRKT